MVKEKIKSSTKKFEMALNKTSNAKYTLKLYVTGMTLQSVQAIESIKKICEEHLSGRYDLQIIDIYQHPVLASGEQIIAAPTLIKKLPLPLRRIIGNMSNVERVLVGLDLREKEK